MKKIILLIFLYLKLVYLYINDEIKSNSFKKKIYWYRKGKINLQLGMVQKLEMMLKHQGTSKNKQS